MIDYPHLVIYVGILFGTAIIAAGIMKFKRKAREQKQNELNGLK